MGLYHELGLEPQVMRHSGGKRPFVVGSKVYADVWTEGIEDLYSPPIRQRILDARQELLKLNVTGRRRELDGVTLASLLDKYGTEVKGWYNDLLAWFGGTCEDYSAYAGVLLARSQMGHDLSLLYPERTEPDSSYSFPGGLAEAALALGRKIDESGAGRIVNDAVVYRVTNERDGVSVSYLQGAQPITVLASVVIFAAPKFIARHVIIDLPQDQREAIGRFKYIPFLVCGVCTRSVISRTLRSARVLRAPIANLRDASPATDRQLFRCEAPLPATLRPQVLTEEYIQALADRIAEVFDRTFPGSRSEIAEVRIWRRGHNWYLPIPGMSTELQPTAARPFQRIIFANADSVGEISEFGWALVAADQAVERAAKLLRSKRPPSSAAAHSSSPQDCASSMRTLASAQRGAGQ
jgi:hypothetical protein